MSKKGMPRAGDFLIKEAEAKMIKALTRTPDPLPALEEIKTRGDNSFFLDRITMESQLRRTVRELFEKSNFTISDLTEPFFPSTSANYINSRSKGGAVGAIYFELMSDMLREELLTFNWDVIDIGHEETRTYGPVGRAEQAVLDNMWLENDNEWKKTLGVYVNVERFTARWRKLYWRIFKRAVDEDPLVSPVGLAEALKIRVISKGPPMLYTALKPLQQFLWRTLKKHEVFELIGTPVTEGIISKCLKDFNPSTDVIVSGDYKASTDNLHSWVSETIVREISEILRLNGFFPEVLEEMFIRSLTRHNFGTTEDPIPQQEGQLMGSITSFPILCIANAAMCRWSLEEANGRVYSIVKTKSVKIAPLRINGDDCVFVGDKTCLARIWEKVTAFGGLSSSVGKTYFSNKFAVINSVLYDYHPARVWLSDPFSVESNDSLTGMTFFSQRSCWIERKYINLGLLYGMQRSSGGDNVRNCELANTLGTMHQMLNATCPPERWENVTKRFLGIHHDVLSNPRHASIPWFIPYWAGGRGLVPQGRRSLQDRYGVAVIKKYWLSKGESCNLSTVSQWKMHKHVLSRLRPYEYDCDHSLIYTRSNGIEKIEDVYSRVYKLCTIETLFTKELEELYEGDTSEKMHNDALSANAHLWRIIQTSPWDLDIVPVEEEELTPQAMESRTPCCIM
jgi:hypothetical protein